ARLGAGHHDHDLAARHVRVALDALAQLTQGTRIARLEALRQLARDDRAPFGAEFAFHVLHELSEPVRRFIKDHRARLIGQRLQTLATSCALRGRESLEYESIGRQSRHRQGGDRSTWTGYSRHL